MTRSVCPRALVSCDCIVEPSLPQMVPSQAYASLTMHLCPASPSHHTLWSTAREMKGDTKKTDGPATYACTGNLALLLPRSSVATYVTCPSRHRPSPMHEKAPQRHHGYMGVYRRRHRQRYVFFLAVNSHGCTGGL